MRVFITGTTGFIGAVLAMRCRELGHDVTAIGQLNTSIEEFRCEWLKKSGIETLQVPLSNRQEISRLVKGHDVVFHLAAAQHEANVSDQHFWDVNVEGTQTILEESQETGVKRFVLGSTIGVYGSALAGEIGENTETHPENVYEVTKLEAEKVARRFEESLAISIIRISETYGPGDGRLLKLFKAIKKRAFFVIGAGANLHQLIHVDDLVRGLLAAAISPRAVGQEIVLAGTERLTTVEMCRCVAEAVRTPLRRFHAPMWPFGVAAVVLESICRPLGIQPPLHRRRLDFFRKSFFFDTRKAAELLDFTPSVTFREGAVRTAQWYSKNGFL